MAASSVAHNFVISDSKSVKRFVEAIDEADRDRTPEQTLPGHQLTDPQEILALIEKKKEKIRYIKNGNSVPAFLI